MLSILNLFGILNVVLIVVTVSYLITSDRQFDFRKGSLSQFGIKPKTAKIFRFTLFLYGISEALFLVPIVITFKEPEKSYLFLLLFPTVLCSSVTALITLKRHYRTHCLFAVSGLLLMSLACFVASLLLFQNGYKTALIGVLLPLLLVVGVTLATLKKYSIGGLTELSFLVCLVIWNIIFFSQAFPK